MKIKINGNIRIQEGNLKNFEEEFMKFLNTQNARFDGETQLIREEPETDIPDVKISSLGLSARTKNALHYNHVFTIRKLSTYYEEEIRSFRNLGNNSYAELIAVLDKYNVHIASCLEKTKELKKIFSKKERAILCRNGITSIKELCKLSYADMVEVMGYRSYNHQIHLSMLKRDNI